ncbi:methyl-accepting chemotaxis protein [Cohnella herbarum]|uniref:Methyl-accepting chemotaxis protein n=1 Tax=Cohnella herbarum TaxID=2728023 RepID=A0A7Z2VJL5_9BACL|nr:methyl-accepting chemotaxis protein [Cohnella herbarum]QJD84264.1 methyl-accepting chemotaxis protein [Cohnella herbarum]
MFNKTLFKATVGKKLYSAFVAVFALVFVFGAIGIRSMSSIQDKTSEITDNWLIGFEQIRSIDYSVEHVLRLAMKIMIEPDKNQVSQMNDEIKEHFAKVDQLLKDYEPRITSEEQRGFYNELNKKWETFQILHEQFLVNSMSVDIVKGAGDKDEVILNALRATEITHVQLQRQLSSLIEINRQGTANASEESQSVYDWSVTFFIGLTFAIVLLSSVLAFFIIRNITKPVRQASRTLERVSSGDFSVEPITVPNKDEIGDLVASLNNMTKDIRHLVSQVTDTTNQVALSSENLSVKSDITYRASNQIAEAIQTIASGSQLQVHSTSDSSKAMENISIGIQQIAATTALISESASETTRSAVSGNETIQQAVTQIGHVSRSFSGFAEDIRDLNQLADEIGGIIAIITGLSNQTNILSLNAAIEAARAGEHGKGFSVISEEIRQLSNQTRFAAEKTRAMITNIQERIEHAFEGITSGVKDIDIGYQKVSYAGKSFEGIVSSAERVSGQTQETAAISEQMSAASEQVAASLMELARIAQDSYEGTRSVAIHSADQRMSAEEMSSLAEQLKKSSQALQQLVGKFSV